MEKTREDREKIDGEQGGKTADTSRTKEIQGKMCVPTWYGQSFLVAEWGTTKDWANNSRCAVASNWVFRFKS